MIKFIKNLRIYDIIWIFFLAFHILPIVPEYIPIGVRIALWIFVFFIFLMKTSFINIWKVLPLYSIAILYIFYSILFNDGSTLQLLYSYLQLMTITYTFFYMIKKNDVRLIRTTVIFLLLFISITAVTTIIGNAIYPGASRVLASSKINPQMYNVILRMNVGGFDFTYTMVLLIPYFVYSMKNRIWPIVPQLLFLFLLVWSIVSTEYTTAILFMFVGVFSFLLPKTFGIKSIFPIILIVILIFSIQNFVPSIFESLAFHIDSEIVSDRMYDVSSVLSGDVVENDSDLGNRINLMKKSINTFIQNPILGSYDSAGGHSYIFDTIGRFGIFGLFGLIIMIYSYCKYFLIPNRRRPYYGHMLLYFVLYLGLLTLNPQPFYLATTLIIPILFQFSSYHK